MFLHECFGIGIWWGGGGRHDNETQAVQGTSWTEIIQSQLRNSSTWLHHLTFCYLFSSFHRVSQTVSCTPPGLDRWVSSKASFRPLFVSDRTLSFSSFSSNSSEKTLVTKLRSSKIGSWRVNPEHLKLSNFIENSWPRRPYAADRLEQAGMSEIPARVNLYQPAARNDHVS